MAGQPGLLRVWTYDAYGNAQVNDAGDALSVTDTVTASVRAAESRPSLGLPTASNVTAAATHYALTVSGTVSGESVLDISINGERVFGAPFRLTVEAAAVLPVACTAVDVPQVRPPPVGPEALTESPHSVRGRHIRRQPETWSKRA
jgi:hypothetical protein